MDKKLSSLARAVGVAGLMLIPVAAPAAAQPSAAPPAVRTVGSVELERYQGRWLQLAAIPAPFLAQCVRDVTADYAIQPDGLVQVVNTCTRADGSRSQLEGRARVVDPSTNARLQVTFVQIAGVWQFAFAGDYWIIGLSKDYRWAVVGDPDRSGGFVLSRTPTLTPAEIVRVLASIVRSGYDPCRFVLTPTAGGVATARGLCEAVHA